MLEHDRQNHYDVVVVNFFLNVFSEKQMRDMLAYLVTLVRPGGKLLISDFATPAGQSDLAAPASGLLGHHRPVLLPARSVCLASDLRLCQLLSRSRPANCCAEKRFRPYKLGPGGFTALTARSAAALA